MTEPAAPQTLAGRVALVTGGSRGIGRAIAQRLAAHGAKVVVTASARSVAGLEQTCAALRAQGHPAAWRVADLADADDRADLVARAGEVFGAIGILVNNAAAITAYAPPSRIDLAARQAMFAINVDAPIDLIQQALPGMLKQGTGQILNISSDTVRAPSPPYPGPAKWVHALAAYGASKAALDRYTVGLAAELLGSGVQVNSLMPYRIVSTEGAAAVVEQMRATHPDWIEPVEVMAEAAYRLITGTHSGDVVVSRDLLTRQPGRLMALDGVTPFRDDPIPG
ncbi:SDR family NAD(P)-dependent oxidoreductase [Polycyclovorans algicola]|uniref:SDR family NAD(P)-dependent oxidoreductase n=1 Tax=Polycyclovorans algicola TaxID=616992 RepID=UPI0004A6A8E3|nr:SDR family NAD(P)-dependent oxidoreductase [Polycyclovorans algicola]